MRHPLFADLKEILQLYNKNEKLVIFLAISLDRYKIN